MNRKTINPSDPEDNIDLADILQKMGEAFVHLDRNWRYRFVNELALRLMAKSREDLIGRTLWEVFPDVAGTVFEAEFRKVMDERVSSSFETFYESNMWLEVRAYPHDGGISIFYSDVTDKKKMMAEVAEISQRFQLFAKMSPTGIFHLDATGKFLFINDRWLEITGLTREEVAGKTWIDIFYGDHSHVQNGIKNASLKQEHPVSRRVHFRNRKTGISQVLHLRINPIEGPIKGCVGTLEDVTEQERAQQIVRDSEKWFRRAADNAPVMIWSSDADHQFNYFNDTWLQFTGKTQEHESGRGWMEAVFGEDRDRVGYTFEGAFEVKRKFRTEFRLKHHDGSYRWVSSTGNPLYGPDGCFLGFIGSCSDIHAQVMANQELERKVAARTLELVAALEHEKELNNMKSRFVSTASHEFRTPLSTILSSAGLIGNYIDLAQPEHVSKHVTKIKTSVRHLTDILNDFLSLEKLEQGSVAVAAATFDLYIVISETIDEVETMLKNGQSIRYCYNGEHAVCSDPKVVYNILLNLLSNAVKYSQSEISVEVDVSDQNICLCITDRGIGIPKADRAFMFSKYFRATNVGNIKGTGLGLTIVQRYIEILNGSISYVSRHGVGTKFTVLIPRQQVSST